MSILLDLMEKIPLESVQKVADKLQRKYATIPVPNAKGLLVNGNLDKFADTLLRHYHFESVDLYSYNYKDEVYNIRRPGGLDEENRQMALHIRAFDIEHSEYDYFILAHWEISRFYDWHAHYNSLHFSWSEGRERTRELIRRTKQHTGEDVNIGEARAEDVTILEA